MKKELLPPTWSSLWSAAQERLAVHPKRAFRKRCLWALIKRAAAREPDPTKVNSANLILPWLAERTDGNHRQGIRGAVAAWNELAEHDPEAGLSKLDVPPTLHSRRLLPLERFSPVFQASCQSYLDSVPRKNSAASCIVPPHLEFADTLARKNKRRRRAPKDAAKYRLAIELAATVAVDTKRVGRSENLFTLETLTDLRQVVCCPELVSLALVELRLHGEALAAESGETYNPLNGHRWHTALLLRTIARQLGADAETCEVLSDLAEDVRPRATGSVVRMGPRHLGKLRKFSIDRNLLAWFDFPEWLFNRAEKQLKRDGKISARSVIDMEVALATQIVHCIPMRPKNLASTQFGNHPGSHVLEERLEGDPWLFHYDPEETKNFAAIEGRLDDLGAQIIGRWLDKEHGYRKAKMRRVGAHWRKNTHLFPAHGLGHVRADSLNRLFRARFMEFTRGEFGEPLDINLHLARHLAAKIILDHDRSMMGFVSVLLGHSSTEVTERFYTEMDKMISQKRYLEILAEQRRRIRTDLPPLRWAVERHDVAA